MCASCGCSDHTHEPDGHDHDHGHHHHGDEPAHVHVRPPTRIVQIEQDVLAKNSRLAERNRGWLEGRGILAWNLMSSPGAGKTTLLERTIRDLGAEIPLTVIEGDQATLRDAERIRAAGCPVVQINTGSGCHLDAEMLAEGLRRLDPLVLTKIDLLPHLEFDVEQCLAHARRVNPRLEIVQVSATRGSGLDAWYGLLRGRVLPAATS
jgi:hydrogenase nickel incorporation protein HypB